VNALACLTSFTISVTVSAAIQPAVLRDVCPTACSSSSGGLAGLRGSLPRALAARVALPDNPR
jgi:hypothetical protein